MRRRTLLAAAAALAGREAPAAPAPLQFPRDHGAHLETRIEWWYATGWLEPPGAAPIGWQVTFFRSLGVPAAGVAGRFAPRQVLFAHAAVSDIGAGRHRHAQRLVRWSGDEATAEARAASADTAVSIGRWSLARSPNPAAGSADGSRYRAEVADDDAGFALALQLDSTQPRLLQGEAGLSRKGPLAEDFSRYYSQPQLAVQARLTLDGRGRELRGTGWLDHEWSDRLLPAAAVGWDWIGINLADGGALTAFRLRRADGSALWAGGSWRDAAGRQRSFGADEVRFEPGRTWRSPVTGAVYPVQWRIETPAGRHRVTALLDAQELDGRGGSGTVYWEGLSQLHDDAGRPAGRGYLEMTGYAQPLAR